jgi:hypothetical protein
LPWKSPCCWTSAPVSGSVDVGSLVLSVGSRPVTLSAAIRSPPFASRDRRFRPSRAENHPFVESRCGGDGDQMELARHQPGHNPPAPRTQSSRRGSALPRGRSNCRAGGVGGRLAWARSQRLRPCRRDGGVGEFKRLRNRRRDPVASEAGHERPCERRKRVPDKEGTPGHAIHARDPHRQKEDRGSINLALPGSLEEGSARCQKR